MSAGEITLTLSPQEVASIVAALVDASIHDAQLSNAYEWPALEARLNDALNAWRREYGAHGPAQGEGAR